MEPAPKITATRHAHSGLTAREAAERLRLEGPNQLPVERDGAVLRLLFGVLREPMFLLLVAATVLYLLLGDLREALVLSASLVFVAAITVLQEWRAGRALAALRDLSSPRAAVVRDGELQRIPGREVVRGDIVLLAEGDRVPADGLLREATELAVDESLLTGESVPVAKRPDADRSAMSVPQGESSACMYAGTMVVRGHGTLEIAATGAGTEVGRIGRVLAAPDPGTTPLFAETRRLVFWLALFGVLLCVSVVVLFAFLRGGWLDGALAGITLAMSILPEECPVVLTVFLALGAWRLSKHDVLTRSMPAIEALGAATVLAVDKTGTLTENRMAVAVLDDGLRRIALGEARVAVDAAYRDLLGAAIAACEIEAFDPMERAIVAATEHHVPDAARLAGMTLAHEYELTPQLLAVTHVWRRETDGTYRVAVKGAPEAVIGLCGGDEGVAARVLQRATELADQGLRVLAVAEGDHAGGPMPASPHGFRLELRGLLGLADPVRASVPAALEECRRAGIRVLMVTGDHSATARSVARTAGLDISAGILTGAEVAALDDAALARACRAVNVYARASPETKLRLVRSLRDAGEIVAMTGDGVNDAPALKAAHIGIAMGRRGSDVAREAAALVLLNDDFSALVAGISTGRRIYQNIRNAMSYLLAAHLPLAGIGLLPLLFGWPLLFFPLHVVFVEFVIDPACSLVFEMERRGQEVMRQPPRDPNERLFSRAMMRESAALGLTSLVATLVAYGTALEALPVNEARAIGFVTLIAGNLMLILVNRSRDEPLMAVLGFANAPFWWIVALATAALAIVLGVPSVARSFSFATPPALGLAAAGILGCGVVAVAGSLRRSRRRSERRGDS
jgi:Ca2+-transporting ATPase